MELEEVELVEAEGDESGEFEPKELGGVVSCSLVAETSPSLELRSASFQFSCHAQLVSSLNSTFLLTITSPLTWLYSLYALV